MRSYLVRTTSIISSLARSGRIKCARKLFDEMPHRDTVAWNTMLTCYTHLGLYQEALSLFHHMTIYSNTKPDQFSLTATLSACAGLCKLQCGQTIHAWIVVTGYSCSLPVSNSLIDMYAKCSCPCYATDVFQEIELKNDVSWCSLLFAYVHANQLEVAESVFDGMPKRVKIAWNTMIAGHARCGNMRICIELFKKMMAESCDEDQWTLSALMNASAESQEYRIGRMVHAVVEKKGWSSAAEAKNSILSFYAQSSSPGDAMKILESIKTLTQVSWNALMDAQMKVGDTHKALIAFRQVPEKNIISWTSMMTGYIRNGKAEEAVSFFIDMITSGIHPDNVSLGTVLHACSMLATLGHGKMIHGFTIHYGFHGYAYVGNGVVNMYAKCGEIEGSYKAFDDIIDKDLVSWNTILLAYGLHGWAKKALEVYEEMIKFLKPDKVTFISLLMTCSHVGFVKKGLDLYKSMISVYGISPELDHVACVVDMLARGGFMEEARAMANTNTTGMNVIKSSEALFGACYSHGDFEMGVGMGLELQMVAPRDEMSYVVMSNLYCANGKWEEAELVRKAMGDHGVKKMAGCSWIEVNNKVRAFVVGNGSHLCEHISFTLYLLHYQLKNPCYHDIEDGIT